MVQVGDQDSAAEKNLDSVMLDTRKLEQTVQELLAQVEVIKNSDIRGQCLGSQSKVRVFGVFCVELISSWRLVSGAAASVTKYFLQSQEAEARANASTVDEGSDVKTSEDLRRLTEDKMNISREDFLKRQSEHAQKLDELAEDLQTLDLSEISQKVDLEPQKPDVS